jgi:hypothetical protein
MLDFITSHGWTVEVNPDGMVLHHKKTDRVVEFGGRKPIIAAYAFVIRDSKAGAA